MTEDTKPITATEVKDNLAALDVGQQASAELPLTEDLLDKLDSAVATRIFGTLMRGEALDPTVAVQAWVEKFAYRQLRTRLTQRVLMGQTAGEELAPDMKKD